MPTNFTTFTILTWWYGTENWNERAIISVIKNGSFGTGFHLHAGCTDAKSDICLTFGNQDDILASRRLTTNSRLLSNPTHSNWTYFGFTYTIPPKGNPTKNNILNVMLKFTTQESYFIPPGGPWFK